LRPLTFTHEASGSLVGPDQQPTCASVFHRRGRNSTPRGAPSFSRRVATPAPEEKAPCFSRRRHQRHETSPRVAGSPHPLPLSPRGRGGGGEGLASASRLLFRIRHHRISTQGTAS